MLHILQPFDHELAVYPGQISGKVIIVRCREIDETLTSVQFLSEMKNCMEQISKPVMLEQLGIFKKREQESLVRARGTCAVLPKRSHDCQAGMNAL